MRTRLVTTVGAGLAATGLLVACGSGSGDSLRPPPTPEATVESSVSSDAQQEPAAPQSVIVCQPGMVDTALTADDVPAWPGPPPAEFELPAPTPAPRGCGMLTGPQARTVYEAAVAHPAALLEEGHLESGDDLSDTSDALWGLDGMVVWIVVEPQW